jgi:hypothetical protein
MVSLRFLFIFANEILMNMKTLTIEYDPQNKDVEQVIEQLISMGIFWIKDKEDEFSRDLEQAISGDELMSHLSDRIYKMFENENFVSPKS